MKSWKVLAVPITILLCCHSSIAQTKPNDTILSVQKAIVKDRLNRKAHSAEITQPRPQNALMAASPTHTEAINSVSDLVKAIWSGIAALVLLPLSYLTKRYFDKFYEKKRIIDELRDLYRHFDRNKEVLSKILQTIEAANGKLSPIHLQKLKVIETSTLLFQTETLRNIDSRYVHFLSRLKIGLRNANIEANGVIAFLASEGYNIGTMKEYLTLLHDRSDDHQGQIKKILDTLGGEIPEKEARFRELAIIYHPVLTGKTTPEDRVIGLTGIENGQKR